MSTSTLFTPALLRTHSFVFFAVHKIRRIFPSTFISKASRHVSYWDDFKLAQAICWRNSATCDSVYLRKIWQSWLNLSPTCCWSRDKYTEGPDVKISARLWCIAPSDVRTPYDTIRYDTRSYFNVRSKADVMSASSAARNNNNNNNNHLTAVCPGQPG